MGGSSKREGRGAGAGDGRKAEVLESERVFEGKLLKIDLEHVRLPGGAEARLETIRHPGAAAALPFLDDGRVVLVRQYRHAAHGFIDEVPAGKLDHGEPPEECVARELVEEVGYRPGRLEPLGAILTTPGFTDEVIWLYEAHELSQAPRDLDPDEVIEPMVVSFEAALEAVRAGRIRDAKSVACILQAALRRRAG